MHRQHHFVSFALWATATAILVQPASAADAPASIGTPSALSRPDFSGVWTKPYLGWELPRSGPGPVTNTMRRRQTNDIDGRPLPPDAAPLASGPARAFGWPPPRLSVFVAATSPRGARRPGGRRDPLIGRSVGFFTACLASQS